MYLKHIATLLFSIALIYCSKPKPSPPVWLTEISLIIKDSNDKLAFLLPEIQQQESRKRVIDALNQWHQQLSESGENYKKLIQKYPEIENDIKIIETDVEEFHKLRINFAYFIKAELIWHKKLKNDKEYQKIREKVSKAATLLENSTRPEITYEQ